MFTTIILSDLSIITILTWGKHTMFEIMKNIYRVSVRCKIHLALWVTKTHKTLSQEEHNVVQEMESDT